MIVSVFAFFYLRSIFDKTICHAWTYIARTYPHIIIPPSSSPPQVRELKREANVMRKELEIAKQKLHDSERVRVLEGEEHLRHATDTEEWLRSELWSKERKCRELEEVPNTT